MAKNNISFKEVLPALEAKLESLGIDLGSNKQKMTQAILETCLKAPFETLIDYAKNTDFSIERKGEKIVKSGELSITFPGIAKYMVTPMSIVGGEGQIRPKFKSYVSKPMDLKLLEATNYMANSIAGSQVSLVLDEEEKADTPLLETSESIEVIENIGFEPVLKPVKEEELEPILQDEIIEDSDFDQDLSEEDEELVLDDF